MPSAAPVGDTAARSVDEQFLELICNDPDLLAAEFDAITAAEWPEPPVDDARPGAGRGRAGSGTAGDAGGPVGGAVSQPRHPGIGGWSRQRSPPYPPLTEDRKADDRPG